MKALLHIFGGQPNRLAQPTPFLLRMPLLRALRAETSSLRSLIASRGGSTEAEWSASLKARAGQGRSRLDSEPPQGTTHREHRSGRYVRATVLGNGPCVRDREQPLTTHRWHVPLAYCAVKVGHLEARADVEHN